MTLAVDLFWSFRSPYSYLATGRLVQLESEWELDVTVRPVLPLAVRTPGFFANVNPLWPPYLLRDTMRIAEFHGIDFAWPRPDLLVAVGLVNFALLLGVAIAANLPLLHAVAIANFTLAYLVGAHLALGHLAVGVPGLVAGRAQILREHGTVSFAELLQPAIKLATHGFPY